MLNVFSKGHLLLYKKTIDDHTEALTFNFCHKWVCTKCLEISEDLYIVLITNPKAPLLVPCKECGEHVSSLQDMRVTLDKVTRNQDDTKIQLSQLSAKICSLNQELKETVKATVKREVDLQLNEKMAKRPN